MKKLIKKTAYWTIPPGFQRLSIYGYRKLSSIRDGGVKLNRANRKFLNFHKGERCFILATGPSINKQDLKPLKNEICISVSMFFLHDDYQLISPSYHVFAPNHWPFGEELCEKYLAGLNDVCANETILFLGDTKYEHSFRAYLKRNPQHKRDNNYYIHYGLTPQINEYNFFKPSIWDISKAPFEIRSVLYSAIQVAVYMGFKDIYLLGADHDYLNNLKRGLSSEHFYDKNNSVDDSLLYNSTEKLFYGYYMRWKQYCLMKQFLERQNRQIINSTEGGMLDVFPIMPLKEVLSAREGE